MNESIVKIRNGKCLCGSSTVSIPTEHYSVGICHCMMCRRWTSGPWMGLKVPKNDVVFKGDHVSRIISSSFAARRFCAACGSSLSHEPKDADYVVVSAGIFEDQNGFDITHVIFRDKEPNWYSLRGKSDKEIKLSSWQTVLIFGAEMLGNGIRNRFKQISGWFSR